QVTFVTGSAVTSQSVPPGTVLTNGLTLSVGGGGAGLPHSSMVVSLQQGGSPFLAIRYAISELADAGATTATSSTATGQSRLSVTASQTIQAEVRVRWTHVTPPFQTGPTTDMRVDIGDDGSVEFFGLYFDPSPLTGAFPVQLGPTPLPIRVSTFNNSVSNAIANSSLLEVEVVAGGVQSVGGDGQTTPAGSLFPQPIDVQVNDLVGQPMPGVAVDFAVIGQAMLSTTNPVTTDLAGRAQTLVKATGDGGPITVTASTPGSAISSTAHLFAHRLIVTRAPAALTLTIPNVTTAVPARVPFIVLCSAPGIAPLPTPIGSICSNPFDPLTFVLEDSIGPFGFVSLSGTGAIGTPSLFKLYPLPAGALAGVTLWFQGIGLDPVRGPFLTNCEAKTL
ncbi:MAG TPA: hypothetical protein VK348_05835, partial [Planctomycetota bacterium]|nr:hypothetical protein [Planctomycetota bacterium]